MLWKAFTVRQLGWTINAHFYADFLQGKTAGTIFGSFGVSASADGPAAKGGKMIKLVCLTTDIIINTNKVVGFIIKISHNTMYTN